MKLFKKRKFIYIALFVGIVLILGIVFLQWSDHKENKDYFNHIVMLSDLNDSNEVNENEHVIVSEYSIDSVTWMSKIMARLLV